jgi:hypothetical protein
LATLSFIEAGVRLWHECKDQDALGRQIGLKSICQYINVSALVALAEHICCFARPEAPSVSRVFERLSHERFARTGTVARSFYNVPQRARNGQNGVHPCVTSSNLPKSLNALVVIGATGHSEHYD